MGLIIWPPVVLSSSPAPVQVENPDGSIAQFNFQPVEDPTITQTNTLSATPATIIAALTAQVKKIIVKNDSGNEIVGTFGSRSGFYIGKGADYEEIDVFGDIGEAFTLEVPAGAGAAGQITISYLG
jgi:hypothetical protein